MDIQELIEQIAATGKEYGMFYFTMEDTSSPMYASAVDCRGKEVARCDYFNVPPMVWLTENKFIYNVEDAIAFLFDCDIHLWQLMSWDIHYDNCGGLIRTWNITLRR